MQKETQDVMRKHDGVGLDFDSVKVHMMGMCLTAYGMLCE